MPVLALLKLIPLKDWLWVALTTLLLIGFGVYTHHERVIGAQKVELADQRAVAAEAAKNRVIESTALSEVNASVKKYQAAGAAPTLPAPRIVCHAADSRPVSDNAGPAGSSDGSSAVPAESTVPFDPAPAILGDARDADAQVTLLQDYVRACQKAGVCKR